MSDVISKFLFQVFLEGPNWLGGWNGIPEHDICAACTKTDSGMWIKQRAECTNLINRLFMSWKIGIYVPVYVVSVFWSLHVITNILKTFLKKPKSTTIIIQSDSLKWNTLPLEGGQNQNEIK